MPSPYGGLGRPRSARLRVRPQFLEELCAEPRLADPRLPITVTSWGSARARRAGRSAAACRGRPPARRAGRRMLVHSRTRWPAARKAGSGVDALRLDRGRRRSSWARRQARAVRSPTSTSPGSAACWSRAAALTASPVTRRSPLSGTARTSPVSIPTRTESLPSMRRDPLEPPPGPRRWRDRGRRRGRQARRRPPSPRRRCTSRRCPRAARAPIRRPRRRARAGRADPRDRARWPARSSRPDRRTTSSRSFALLPAAHADPR